MFCLRNLKGFQFRSKMFTVNWKDGINTSNSKLQQLLAFIWSILWFSSAFVFELFCSLLVRSLLIIFFLLLTMYLLIGAVSASKFSAMSSFLIAFSKSSFWSKDYNEFNFSSVIAKILLYVIILHIHFKICKTAFVIGIRPMLFITFLQSVVACLVSSHTCK